MKVQELTRDQLTELKQRYLCENGNPSWGDMAEPDEVVSDETIFAEFEGIDFTEDDFFGKSTYTIKISSSLFEAINTILYGMKDSFVKNDPEIFNDNGYQSDGNMGMPLIFLSQEEYIALMESNWKIDW